MITGPHAITAMRELDDIVNDMQSFEDEDPEGILFEFSERLARWRNELIEQGGIQPVKSYTELLSPGDTL